MFYFVGFTKHIYLTHYSLLCGLTVICNKDFYYIHSIDYNYNKLSNYTIYCTNSFQIVCVTSNIYTTHTAR